MIPASPLEALLFLIKTMIGSGELVRFKIKMHSTVGLPKKNSLFSPPFHMIMWGAEKIFNGIVAFSKIYLNIVTRCKIELQF